MKRSLAVVVAGSLVALTGAWLLAGPPLVLLILGAAAVALGLLVEV